MWSNFARKTTEATVKNTLFSSFTKRSNSFGKEGFPGGWDESVHLGKIFYSPKVGFYIENGVANPDKTLYAQKNALPWLEDRARRFARYEQAKGEEYEHAMHHGQKPGDTWPFPTGNDIAGAKLSFWTFWSWVLAPAAIGAYVVSYQQDRAK